VALRRLAGEPARVLPPGGRPGAAERRPRVTRRTVGGVTEPLLHLVPASAFDPDDPAPLAPAAGDVGLRCARPDQAAGLARLLFAGSEDLLLLVIDPRRLGSAEVVERDVYGIGLAVPVVAGPVPRTAVVDVVAFPPGRGGRWSRPDVGPLR
jgi:uncharacterized protein (DUF952 family)